MPKTDVDHHNTFDVNISIAVRVFESFSYEHLSLLSPRQKFHILCSKLLLTDCDATIHRILDDLQPILSRDRSLSPRALTLIMHKLSLITNIKKTSSTVSKKLLETMVSLAKDKSCVASILAFINFMGNQSSGASEAAPAFSFVEIRA